jgi:hypothetical protein
MGLPSWIAWLFGKAQPLAPLRDVPLPGASLIECPSCRVPVSCEEVIQNGFCPVCKKDASNKYIEEAVRKREESPLAQAQKLRRQAEQRQRGSGG